MPASYRIDTVAGVVFITHSGRVSDEDILTNQQRLREDPQFLPTLDHLVDARDVTEQAITAHGVRALASANIYAPGSRRAIVVSDDVTYGYTRMFQILRDRGPEEIQIFRSLADARRWLVLAEQSPE
jgi:hypothetical protein